MKITRYILAALISYAIGGLSIGYLVFERTSNSYRDDVAYGHIRLVMALVNQADQIDQGKATAVARNVDNGLCLFTHSANWYIHRNVQAGFASHLLDLIGKRRQQVLTRESPATFAGYQQLADCDMDAETGVADLGEAADRI